MLQSISWVQFGIFLLVAGAVYYLYVIIRFYRREVIAFLSGRKRPGVISNGPGNLAAGSEAVTVVSKAEKAVLVSDHPDLFEGTGYRAGQVGRLGGMAGQKPELFKVMEKVMTGLKEMIHRDVADGVSREELLEQIKEVLSRYGQLKDTPYQLTVNNYLFRSCSSNFSLLLGEEELDSLWG